MNLRPIYYYVLLLLSCSTIFADICENRQTREIVVDTFCTLTICCESINNNFIETFSLIAEIEDTFNTCCNAIITEITTLSLSCSSTVDFSEVFTVIADLQDTLTTCCVIVQNDLNTVLTTVETLTVACVCEPTPITSAGTITSPGFYCLSNDITGQLTIASNNVVLDLNDHQISGGTNGVVINASMQNVVIRNGSIINTTAEGVLVGNGCVNIEIIALNLVGCGDYGVKLNGTGVSRISSCMVQDVSVQQSIGGIQFNDVDYSLIDACRVSSCVLNTGNGGIDVRSSTIGSGITVANCFVASCTIADSGAIYITNQQSSVVTNCLVQDITVLAASFGSGIGCNNAPFTVMDTVVCTSLASTATATVAGIEITSSANASVSNATIANITSSGLGIGVLITTAPSTIVNGFTISQVVSGGSRGVSIDASAECSVQQGVVTSVLSTGDCDGILVSDSASTFIDQCEFNGLIGSSNAIGIDVVASSSGVIIQDCHILAVVGQDTAEAIRIDTSPSSILQGCLINSLTGLVTSNGVDVVGSSNANVANCIVQDISMPSAVVAGNGIVVTNSPNSIILNCDIENINGGSNTDINGIGIASSANAIVRNCRVMNVSGESTISGILLNGSSAVSVSQCCVSDIIATVTLGTGIYLNDADNSLVVGCIAKDCSQDAYRLESNTANSSVGESVAYSSINGFFNNDGVYPAAGNNQFFNCFSGVNSGVNYFGAPAVVALGGVPVVGTNING